VPVAPLGFTPKKSPVRYDRAQKKYYNHPRWQVTPPITDTQPYANIGVATKNGLVALDYDHDEAALIISEAFPASPVNKAGKTAFTAFYRVDFEVLSEDFHDDAGELVLQILGKGKQTVIPPSIHPDTFEPYRWTNGHSLYDTPLEALPLLPRDYRERILALGYKSGRGTIEDKERSREDARLRRSDQGEPDGPYGEINELALRDLSKWVPDLKIYKLRRKVGRFANYEGGAVAAE
jgi:hypothetical protein